MENGFIYGRESQIIINNLTPRRIARLLRAQVGGIVNVGFLEGLYDVNPRENVHIRSTLTSAHPDSSYRRGTRG